MEKTITFNSFKVIAAGRQIVGNRERQEDSFRVSTDGTAEPSAHLIGLLSDGMGGMGDGDKASAAIADSFLEAYRGEKKADLLSAIRHANLTLRQLKQENRIGVQAGGTFIAVQVGEEGISWLSIGDSLLYLQRDNKITKLNDAHTWAWELERRVRNGEITEQEAAENPTPRHALYAAVCGNDIPAVDICDPPFHARIGDRIIIASDGLLPLLPGDPATLFNEPGIRGASPAEACSALLNRLSAANLPHQDNCSILIIDICPAKTDPPPAAVGAWRSCCVSAIGDRGSQQDATLVLHSPHAVLAVVADGAGGHADGATASATAVAVMQALWQSTLSAGLSTPRAAQALSNGLIEAHGSILEKAGGNHKRSGKCAVVALYISGREYTVVNAGDCRCYHETRKGWGQLTKDDSLLQIMLDKGMITPREAVNSPDQGVLTQALGGETPPNPHIIQGTCSKASSFLLCCDGLWHQLPPQWEQTPWDCTCGEAAHRAKLANKVALAVNNADGDSDNVSAIWVYGANHSIAPHSNAGKTAFWLSALITLLVGLATAGYYYSNPESPAPQPAAGKQLTVTAPQHTDTAPQHTDTAPQHTDTAPQSADTAPQSADTAPQPAVTAPQPADTAPQSADTTPQPADTAPQPADTTPQPAVTAPQSAGTAPQSADTAPQPAGTAPQSADTAPQSADTAPQPADTAPQPADTAPQSADTAPQSADTASQQADTFEAVLLRTIHHGEDKDDKHLQSTAISPDGKYLATGSWDNTARITDIATGNTVREIKHNSIIWSVAFSPDGKYLATGSEDDPALITDLATGKTVREIKHNNLVTSVSFSPDGKYLATGSLDHTARITDIATGNTVREIKHVLPVTSVAFSPDGKYLATGSWDHTARITDIATGKTVREIKHNDLVTSVSFSPDGKYLATGSLLDNTARITDIATENTVREIKHSNRVISVAFSPDGKYLATGSWDNTARITDIATGNTVREIKLSPDGKYLATGSGDCTITDLATGKTVREIKHNGIVISVSFSPDGKYLATGSEDGEARVYELKYPAE